MPASHLKLKERIVLSLRIAKSGIEMFPCSNCEGRLQKCYVSVDAKSKRCGNCVKRGLSCNVDSPSVSDWASLERAEEEVSQKLAQATSDLHACIARQSRLMKQQEFFKSRAKEMLKRGLESLDELDAQEEKEKNEKDELEKRASEAKEKEEDLAAAQLASDSVIPSDYFWALLDSCGEMPPTSQGS